MAQYLTGDDVTPETTLPMITPANPANGPEPMTFAELRALLEETSKTAAENTRAIIEMRAANAERDAREEERAARHDKEMAEIRAAIARLTEAQNRTNQEVSTLKGWGLELYCQRNPEIFAEALGLGDEELIPKRQIRRIASAATLAGVITPDQRRNLGRADVFIYARRESDRQPFCLVVEASYQVDNEDVYRAADRAEILDIILKKYQPRNLNGQAIPIVAGIKIETGASFRIDDYNVKYVPIQNGTQLTNPPE